MRPNRPTGIGPILGSFALAGQRGLGDSTESRSVSRDASTCEPIWLLAKQKGKCPYCAEISDAAKSNNKFALDMGENEYRMM
jgi:hypothetical protein